MMFAFLLGAALLCLNTSGNFILLLADADRIHDLVVVPGTNTVLVLAEQSARAAQEVRQVLLLDERKQVGLVAATLDCDLSTSLLVQEALDHSPYTTEKHGSVHDKGLTHDLRVIVRTHLRGQLDQCVHLL